MSAARGLQLPYPVASACDRMLAVGDDPPDRLRYLLFCAESLLQLCGTAVLVDASEAVRREHASSALRKALSQLKLQEGGLGLWCQCLRTLRPEEPFLRELAALHADQARMRALVDATRRITEERNHLSHPVRKVPRPEAERRLKTLEPAFDTLMATFEFLASYHLLTVDSCRYEREGIFRLEMRLARGPHPTPRLFRTDAGRPLNKGDVLLVRVDADGEEALLLSPLYQVVDPPNDLSKGLFAYRRCEGSQLLYYGVADPEELHREGISSHGLLELLTDPNGRRRRGPQGLSSTTVEALRQGRRPPSGELALEPPPAPERPAPRPHRDAPPPPRPPDNHPAPAAPAEGQLPPRRRRRWLLMPLGLGAAGLGLLWLYGPRVRSAPERTWLARLDPSAVASPTQAALPPPPGELPHIEPEAPQPPPSETPWTRIQTPSRAALMDVWADDEGRLLVAARRARCSGARGMTPRCAPWRCHSRWTCMAPLAGAPTCLWSAPVAPSAIRATTVPPGPGHRAARASA
ncbi:MAG: hypothetical protein RMK29_10190 [Myxococcales bacterium]|nr:hypothetical protein [Myxococcota bacterium]MDW8282072.1 hypothetical protein [Myxococcales bacterium]